jgi:general secretion pathway protein B
MASEALTPDDSTFISIERESRPLAPSEHAEPSAPASANPPVPEASTAEPAHEPNEVSAELPITNEQTEPELPRLRELDAAQRNLLPPLKLSMHVYTEVPTERFVLIDGKRHEEGGMLAPSLIVEEIRRDGAVLNFNERRFLLPRP